MIFFNSIYKREIEGTIQKRFKVYVKRKSFPSNEFDRKCNEEQCEYNNNWIFPSMNYRPELWIDHVDSMKQY